MLLVLSIGDLLVRDAFCYYFQYHNVITNIPYDINVSYFIYLMVIMSSKFSTSISASFAHNDQLQSQLLREVEDDNYITGEQIDKFAKTVEGNTYFICKFC